ncbi:MAG: TIGR04500 family putative peptide maturation system protein [Aphanothece sp. CMT-3BRIN-NPC111]|nr:TIGR04500 family putative peptide maturation system protein [Aphanothece sp. CMT-3BRIN-NPC111]
MISETIQRALLETLECLVEVQNEQVDTEGAIARLGVVQERHPDLNLDLLWEEEGYTEALHYDALLHLPGGGTVSLSYCPEKGVPWLLRGGHFAREYNIVRVNSITLDVQYVVSCLDFLWNEARLIARLVNRCLIDEAILKRGIQASPGELQRAMDEFRRSRRLFTAEDTLRWLEQQGTTHKELEQMLAAEVNTRLLREQITGGRVEQYFRDRRSKFDTACIARFRVATQEHAQHLSETIRSGAMDFYDAAESSFLTCTDREEKGDGKLFARIQRRLMSPQQATEIFAASPGAVVGPVSSGDGYDIIRVLEIHPACLDERTCEAVKEALFTEWLAQERQKASIEWFWGRTEASRSL